MGPVPPTVTPFRVILESSWVIEGEIQYLAFYPRIDDSDGLSLSLEKKRAGCKFRKPIFGFLKVFPEVIRTIVNDGFDTLNVIQDTSAHAVITGIPFFHSMPKATPEEKMARKAAKNEAKRLAQHLADRAASKDEMWEEGFHPALLFSPFRQN